MKRPAFRDICHPAHPDFRLDTSPFYLMAHADFAYHRDMSKVLSRHGVDRSIYRIMTVLREQQPANIGLLAERALMKRNTASRVVERMEERGLVSTGGNPTDSRATDVVLTERGTELLNTLTPIVGLQFQRAVENLGEDELAQLVLLLQKVRANLQRPAAKRHAGSDGRHPRTGFARLPAGQVWAASLGPSAGQPVVVRIEASQAKGRGMRFTGSADAGLRSDLKAAGLHLQQNAAGLVGERALRGRALLVSIQPASQAPTIADGRTRGRGSNTFMPAIFLALCSCLLRRPLRKGLVCVGALPGAALPARPLEQLIEQAAEQGARVVLVPITARRAVAGISDDVAARLDIVYFASLDEALLKALRE